MLGMIELHSIALSLETTLRNGESTVFWLEELERTTDDTSKEISEGLASQFQLDVPKQKIVLDEPIKAFGTYEVKAKLGYEVSARFSVSVSEE